MSPSSGHRAKAEHLNRQDFLWVTCQGRGSFKECSVFRHNLTLNNQERLFAGKPADSHQQFCPPGVLVAATSQLQALVQKDILLIGLP